MRFCSELEKFIRSYLDLYKVCRKASRLVNSVELLMDSSQPRMKVYRNMPASSAHSVYMEGFCRMRPAHMIAMSRVL